MKKDADYREKIKKLLALAESPNENEARAALLKARELMAEHKLTEAECVDIGKREVKHIHTGISFSKRRNPWTVHLATLIGEHYCCQSYRQHERGRQTNMICFVGLDEDAEVCAEIFKYAYDCVVAGTKKVRSENLEYPTEYIKRFQNSYGYGFCRGLMTAYEKQAEEKEEGWGLVLAIPKEVTEETDGMKKQNFNARAEKEIYRDDFINGYRDGKAFSPNRRLEEVTA